ncbi:MAG: hypothetical protein HYX24_05240 [Candidatus Aenigmarchaeota archaeon]|nr:hypothetical protein [Candidatus Aenigmarchaeota archaeon]
MDSHQVFGLLGGACALLGFVAYIFDLLRLKDQSKATKSTWLIWTINMLILTVSYWFAGARNTIYLPMAFLTGNIVMLALILRYGRSGFSPLDKICFAGAIISLLLWAVTYNPISTVIMNRIIAWIGAVPTIRQAFLDPKSENRLAWGFFNFGTIVSIFAIEDWTMFVEPWFTLNVAALNGSIFFLSIRGRRTDHKSSEKEDKNN